MEFSGQEIMPCMRSTILCFRHSGCLDIHLKTRKSRPMPFLPKTPERQISRTLRSASWHAQIPAPSWELGKVWEAFRGSHKNSKASHAVWAAGEVCLTSSQHTRKRTREMLGVEPLPWTPSGFKGWGVLTLPLRTECKGIEKRNETCN